MEVNEMRHLVWVANSKNAHDSLCAEDLAKAYDGFKSVVEEKKAAVLNKYPTAYQCERFKDQNKARMGKIKNMSVDPRVVILKTWIRMNRLGVVRSVSNINNKEYRIGVRFDIPAFPYTVENPLEMIYAMQTFNMMAHHHKFALRYNGFHSIEPKATIEAKKYLMDSITARYPAKDFEFITKKNGKYETINEYRFTISLDGIRKEPDTFVYSVEDNFNDNVKMKRTVAFHFMNELTIMMNGEEEKMAKKFDMFDDVMTIVDHMLDMDSDKEKYQKLCKKYETAAKECMNLIMTNM